MRLSNIVRLYRVRLRSRIVQELFAVLGIAVGVALLFSSQVASTSLDGAVRQLTSGIVGQMRFQITARDSHGFDAALLSKVERIPGVLTAVPVLQESANVVGPNGSQSVDLVGTEPRLAYLGGALVRKLGTSELSRTRAFMLPAPIAQTSRRVLADAGAAADRRPHDLFAARARAARARLGSPRRESDRDRSVALRPAAHGHGRASDQHLCAFAAATRS